MESEPQMEEEPLGEPNKKVKQNENEATIHERILEENVQCERENIVLP
jgi:hypothetical protein